MLRRADAKVVNISVNIRYEKLIDCLVPEQSQRKDMNPQPNEPPFFRFRGPEAVCASAASPFTPHRVHAYSEDIRDGHDRFALQYP